MLAKIYRETDRNKEYELLLEATKYFQTLFNYVRFSKFNVF